jgi:hypothetical protein
MDEAQQLRAVIRRQRALELKLAGFISEHAHTKKLAEDLKHEVWGNGKDGLDVRVDRMEQSRLTEKEASDLRHTRITSLASLGGTLLLLLSMLLQYMFGDRPQAQAQARQPPPAAIPQQVK